MDTKQVILELRTQKGMSQDELAEKVFVSRQAVSRWENGETVPNTETLKLLSKVFDVSINTLLGSPRKLICQCCGMPLEDDDIIGHNHDGSFNEDYCKWCYADGTYTYNDMDDLIEVCVKNRTKGSKSGCYFNVNTTKTPASMRQVPMLGFVREAFEQEKQKQEDLGLHCEVTIDGYTDFIFINRFGQAQHQATLNKAIRRIIRDCNDEQFLHSDEPDVLLPHFSCHSLRHTFTTRMCEAGVNIKVIQDALGHSDISTTLNIYADVTKEMKAEEFKGLDSYFKV